MTTEAADPRFVDIDSWPTAVAVEAMLDGQMSALAAIRACVPDIARASEAAAERLLRGGRLIYAGAGTSGRIAAQDGVELGPTFGWPANRLGFVIAGGLAALSHSAEGAEDDAADARSQLHGLDLSAGDVVVGVAASGGTPFTVAAIELARNIGALTVAVANNPGTSLPAAAEHALIADTGSEPIAGSTRMKAGTAQKAILNLFSTATMVRCGRVYRGMMVNMIVSNEKLARRAGAMVIALSGCSDDAARAALRAADNDVALAVLIAMGHRAADARAALLAHDGNLRGAIARLAQEAG